MKNRKINTFIASGVAALAAVGVFAGLTACSSGPATPQNATQVLQNDGYTPSAAYTGALQGGLDSNGPDAQVTSSQAGTNSAGDIQGVVIFDNAADAQAGAGAVGGTPGIAVVTNGDVVTMTGTVSAWASVGGS